MVGMRNLAFVARERLSSLCAGVDKHMPDSRLKILGSAQRLTPIPLDSELFLKSK